MTIFFDACYSGTSRDNKSLLVSARPIQILKEEVNNISLSEDSFITVKHGETILLD